MSEKTETTDVATEVDHRADGINLSAGAADKVKSLLQQEGLDDLALRIAVQPGGCSGLRYQLFFDERSLDGDVVTDFGGVSVVVDRMSVPYLNGAYSGEDVPRKVARRAVRCGDVSHQRPVRYPVNTAAARHSNKRARDGGGELEP